MKNENWILHISIELMRKIIFSSSSDNLNSIIYRSLFFILSNQILSPRSSFVNLIYEVISSWLFSFVSLIFFFFFLLFFFPFCNNFIAQLIFVNFCLRRNFCSIVHFSLGYRSLGKKERGRTPFSFALSWRSRGMHPVEKETIVLCCDKICTSLSIVRHHSFPWNTLFARTFASSLRIHMCVPFASVCRMFLVNGIKCNSWIIW